MQLVVESDAVFGCELVLAPLDRDGYGRIGRKLAHVALWEREHGPVPHGMELDHLCRRRACVALHHLEVVTRGVNEQRKLWRVRARRTHCPRGHDMKLNAAVTSEGGRVCRACNQEAKGQKSC